MQMSPKSFWLGSVEAEISIEQRSCMSLPHFPETGVGESNTSEPRALRPAPLIVVISKRMFKKSASITCIYRQDKYKSGQILQRSIIWLTQSWDTHGFLLPNVLSTLLSVGWSLEVHSNLSFWSCCLVWHGFQSKTRIYRHHLSHSCFLRTKQQVSKLLFTARGLGDARGLHFKKNPFWIFSSCVYPSKVWSFSFTLLRGFPRW